MRTPKEARAYREGKQSADAVLETIRQQRDVLQKKLESMTQQRDVLVDGTLAAAATTTAHTEGWKAKLEQVETDLSYERDISKAMREQRDEYTYRFNKATEQRDDFSKKLKKALAENQRLAAEILDRDLLENAPELNGLDEPPQTLKRALAVRLRYTQDELAAVKAENQRLATRLRQEETQLKLVRNQRDEAYAEIDTIRDVQKKQKEEIARLQGVLGTSQALVEELRKKISKLQLQGGLLRVSDRSVVAYSLQSEVNRLQGKVDNLSRELAGAEATIERLRGERLTFKATADFTEIANALDVQKSLYNQSREQLTGERENVRRLERELADLRESYRNTTATLTHAQKELTDLREVYRVNLKAAHDTGEKQQATLTRLRRDLYEAHQALEHPKQDTQDWLTLYSEAEQDLRKVIEGMRAKLEGCRG